MTEKNTLAILAAAEAIAIVERTNRWREFHCFTLMDHTLERIKELSIAGHREYVAEAVGENVNLEGYIKELEKLSYTVANGGPNYSNRTVIITW